MARVCRVDKEPDDISLMMNRYGPDTAPDPWQPALIRGVHPVTGKSHLVIPMHGVPCRCNCDV